jgi:hypothetical protein
VTSQQSRDDEGDVVWQQELVASNITKTRLEFEKHMQI